MNISRRLYEKEKEKALTERKPLQGRQPELF